MDHRYFEGKLLYSVDQSGRVIVPGNVPCFSPQFQDQGCGPTSQAMPPYPTQLPPDDGLASMGRHGAFWPLRFSGFPGFPFFYLLELDFYEMAVAADGLGLDNAARHMFHYLGNSGATLDVNVSEMLADLPTFRRKVTEEFRNRLFQEVNRKIAQEYHQQDCMAFQLTTVSVASDWRKVSLEEVERESQDWYFAVGHFYFSLGANVVVIPTGTGWSSVQVCYQIYVFDQYNWHPGLFEPTPDVIPGSLHATGQAQMYEIRGTSEPVCVNYTYMGNGTPAPVDIPLP